MGIAAGTGNLSVNAAGEHVERRNLPRILAGQRIMAERDLRIRLGIFVAFSLAALAGLIIVFGGTPQIFSNRLPYSVFFSEAPGVSVGTPVRKSGVRIGEVTQIDLDPETGEVRVEIRVDPRHPPRPSELATIARGILSGDTTLDFVPRVDEQNDPVPTQPPYPPGSRLRGETPINARGLLSRANAVLPTAQESLLGIQHSFQRFEQAMPKVEAAMMNIANMAAAAQDLFRDLQSTNQKIQELIGLDDPPLPVDRVVAQLPTSPTPPAGQPQNPSPRNQPPEAAPPTVKAALAEIVSLLRDARPVATELQDLLRTEGREIGRAARSIRETTANVNSFLTPENRKAASELLKNLEQASGDLTKTIRLAAILLDQGERTVRELNARLAQSEKLISNLQTATKPVADNAEQIVRDVAATVRTIHAAADQLNIALTDIREVIRTAAKGEGTVQKLLTDPTLFNNLNESVFAASRLLLRAEKIARDLEVFADKIARRPETLGIGGAVRPSSGLKESPHAPLPQPPLPPIAPLPSSWNTLPPNSNPNVPQTAPGLSPNSAIPPLSSNPNPPSTAIPVFRPGLPPDRPPM